MNRLLSPRVISLCLATLSLPALLTACASQGASTTAPTTTVADTTVADTGAAPSTAADTKAPDAKAPDAPPADAPTDAPAPTAKTASYKVNHEVPPGLTEAQMKKLWVPIPPAKFALGAKPRVRLTTSKGAIVVALDPKEAPLHARSFVYLAKQGFFNNSVFHRWADLTGDGGTIIQGGDPLSRNAETLNLAGQGGPGYTIPRERNQLKHDALVIAAARTQDPDSAGSQFYITQAPVYYLDTAGDGYTVFGRVVEGADVAKKLRQDDKILRAEVLK